MAFDGRVVRVVDGDTLDADLDLGFRIWMRVRLRLDGIDTPERGSPGAEQAKQYLASRVEGKDVRVETSKPDKYGRTLAVIRDDGGNVNLAMLALGLCREYHGEAKGG